MYQLIISYARAFLIFLKKSFIFFKISLFGIKMHFSAANTMVRNLLPMAVF